MRETRPPVRHPSTLIPASLVEELCYRVYLRRLEPPMTVEQSLATTYYDDAGRPTASDALRRKRSESYQPLIREMLRALVDMGMIDLHAQIDLGDTIGLFG